MSSIRASAYHIGTTAAAVARWCLWCVSGVDDWSSPANGSRPGPTLSKATDASRASPRTDRPRGNFLITNYWPISFIRLAWAWAWAQPGPAWRSHIYGTQFGISCRDGNYMERRTDFYWMGNFMRSKIMIIQQSIIYLNSQSHWAVGHDEVKGAPNKKWNRVCPFHSLWPFFFLPVDLCYDCHS